MRRDYNNFKTYNRSSYVKFNGDKPKTYLDYLMESDYSKTTKEFYKRVYLSHKGHQCLGSKLSKLSLKI